MKPQAITRLLVSALAMAFWFGGSATARAQSNPVRLENAKPGSTDWLLTRVVRHDDEIYELGWHRRRGIEAYASRTSVKPGETLDVHVSTYPVNQYSVSIYRMGYYGGAGARLVADVNPSAALPQSQPSCISDAATGNYDCGNWAVSASWNVPATAVSGVYFAKLDRQDREARR